MTTFDVDTPRGPARVHLQTVESPVGAVVLGHGAAGGVGARDLRAAAKAAGSAGWTVALVEQPYTVAGRRTPAPAPQLDEAWTAVLEHLRSDSLEGLPIVTGGRSAGARVACRTAAATGAVGVLCLAFPEHPPGRPEKTRQPELDGVEVPVLVIQGESDPFGMPDRTPTATIVRQPGNHSLTGDLDGLAAAVRDWLPAVLR